MSKHVQTAPETALAVKKEIALPDGQILDLNDMVQVARAYDDVQRYKTMLREAESQLKEALIAHSTTAGSKTFTVEGAKVEVKGGKEKRYDAQGLKRALKAAGMPEDRLKEIVRETIEYKVAAVEANRAARANEDYAKIIDEHTTVVEKNPSVSVTRIGGTAVHPPVLPSGEAETTAEAPSAPADNSAPELDEDSPW